MSVFMMLRDIHEEAGPEEGIYGGHTLAWEDVARERRERIERDPYVLIGKFSFNFGGGQMGLNVAARFTAKDRVGQWLQQYAESADLAVWTSSYPFPTPSYDNAGVLGAQNYPTVCSPELFTGLTLHAANYHGGALYSGPRVIVVGAGNSAADICQDLVVHDVVIYATSRVRFGELTARATYEGVIVLLAMAYRGQLFLLALLFHAIDGDQLAKHYAYPHRDLFTAACLGAGTLKFGKRSSRPVDASCWILYLNHPLLKRRMLQLPEWILRAHTEMRSAQRSPPADLALPIVMQRLSADQTRRPAKKNVLSTSAAPSSAFVELLRTFVEKGVPATVIQQTPPGVALMHR
ncbi:hypothetical protein FB45DRAFT_1110310 [Roridomyces roridus]|uniref:Flavin-containing monooxygenase n=1 Tax=Roridomyces roridus TaxID=1738132 RepID=A0AAD7B991_9AGAR|nr:hypothetical protein FB45DRAFT_1110310 [Roridomyces roridus]